MYWLGLVKWTVGVHLCLHVFVCLIVCVGVTGQSGCKDGTWRDTDCSGNQTVPAGQWCVSGLLQSGNKVFFSFFFPEKKKKNEWKKHKHLNTTPPPIFLFINMSRPQGREVTLWFWWRICRLDYNWKSWKLFSLLMALWGEFCCPRLALLLLWNFWSPLKPNVPSPDSLIVKYVYRFFRTKLFTIAKKINNYIFSVINKVIVL